MKRKAFATWEGGLMEGRGTITSESGAFSGLPYGYPSRFGGEKGPNPEEFIGAALAACFSMSLSHELERTKTGIGTIRTDVTVNLEKKEEGWAITHAHLDVVANIPAGDSQKFQEAAEKAKRNCPVSKLLNARITMSCKLAEPLAESA